MRGLNAPGFLVLPEEHYTDTHGYTEINFAAFAMIGMRFCPRIRNVHRQRIYCANRERDHGPLETVLRRGRRAVNFRLIAEQWERIGQFYAAFPAGHATASAALQRLNRFQASNRFYAANRELGRVFKTEFVLQYMAEPQLRAKVLCHLMFGSLALTVSQLTRLLLAPLQL